MGLLTQNFQKMPEAGGPGGPGRPGRPGAGIDFTPTQKYLFLVQSVRTEPCTASAIIIINYYYYE